jgi:environmental stress-induced protein Ves
MIVIQPYQYRRMPWKNGGGSTTEIAISPGGAGLDDFDWRVSIAGVAEAGAFSAFPGIDRTLSVLDGAGLRLEIDGGSVTLIRRSPPLAFPGDANVQATPIDGPITDLNIMTRRRRYRHTMLRLTARQEMTVWCCGAVNLIFSVRDVRIEQDGAAAEVGAGATARFDGPAGPLELTGSGLLEIYLIEVFAL